MKNNECRILHSDFCLLHLQMWRLPFFDDVREGKFDLVCIEREPTQLCADGLFFEFGAAPNKGRADDTDDDRAPIGLNEERREDDKKADAHHVDPSPIAKISFAADDQRKAEPDDEEGYDADKDAKEIHSYQCLVISE